MGPRSSSPMRVAIRYATRSGLLSTPSSSMCGIRASYDDVPVVDPHQQPSTTQRLQYTFGGTRLRVGRTRHARRIDSTDTVRQLPDATFVVVQHAHQADAIWGFEGERQAVSFEHRLDGIPMTLGHA